MSAAKTAVTVGIVLVGGIVAYELLATLLGSAASAQTAAQTAQNNAAQTNAATAQDTSLITAGANALSPIGSFLNGIFGGSPSSTVAASTLTLPSVQPYDLSGLTPDTSGLGNLAFNLPNLDTPDLTGSVGGSSDGAISFSF